MLRDDHQIDPAEQSSDSGHDLPISYVTGQEDRTFAALLSFLPMLNAFQFSATPQEIFHHSARSKNQQDLEDQVSEMRISCLEIPCSRIQSSGSRSWKREL